MTRTTLNFVIDALSGIIGLGLVITGLIMYFVLPPGSRQVALWGYGRHDWGGIHSWLALGVVIIMLIHLALHWTWVCAYVRRAVTRTADAPVTNRNGIYGVALVLLITGAFVAFVQISRDSVQPARGVGEHREESAEGVGRGARLENTGESGRPSINGSITLAEAARITAQTPAEVKQKLGLAQNTSEQMRLREVMENTGKPMTDIRVLLTQAAQGVRDE